MPALSMSMHVTLSLCLASFAHGLRVSDALRRRSVISAGAAFSAAPAFRAAAAKPAASDGAWAKHFSEFEASEFEGMVKSPSGLEYRIVEEGYGVKPQAGQKIKAHYAVSSALPRKALPSATTSTCRPCRATC